MSKVWLVTGSARGLGRHIVEAALEAGERVLATARDPRRLDDLAARYGERVKTAALDVTDPAAARSAVQAAVDAFGRIDVLVNNAGFGHISPFEQSPEDDFRAQIDTNFYGVVNVTRAVLPVMRAQKSGHILHVSSVGGRIGNAGLAAYQSAKWAVGGFTEVLRQELAPIGIHMTALEPGGMATDWGTEAGSRIPPLLPEYEPSIGALLKLFADHIGKERGDPTRVAQVVLQLTRHNAPPAHLLLGSDALQFSNAADAARAAEGERWRDVTLSTDFGSAGTIAGMPRD
ncbi:SDR family NAD(P)-dependent oxidoreductase [Paraburkholderia silvatlantica]|uniref:NAD(P)-dependent dehydrogenase (Short-subunit alcohol dehydrogenase family) n=1 Tax=Paraburkholderia silvatlantica TaxID=321895 RepID=A0A2U1A8A6_9BURK|nr:SDR family NAD(P)-dependent oxidoreductase [Paraburkholderia silvatlantica]MBB2929022.1 NAD(P)-dependent dehydrogenase (short-subunit alcohol dehydrogenase family) [Paraburkholderia silvatlantica]PVY29117.1 NADP-dependent 3-hydroxy acid dehydrogenase YdfG [Paraburkholderia silvatlantica]PXW36592.1 NADP-dependent 3-hydroxy acid dehydrogenase YdfG [Paraburkholderia silvatlantica]PYE22076.1 NADP-dependent 3-hydroxy acid dehydrogenase YdfG [Paraburkholderia silvatlantica]TDQ98980.1 NADP-depende